jgi:hypothetical protein
LVTTLTRVKKDKTIPVLKMTYFKIFLALIFLTSCIDKEERKVSNKDLINWVPANSYDPSSPIIGEWSISATMDDSSSTVCNVCPQVKFLNNNVATVLRSNNESLSYRWNIVADTIFFSYIRFSNNANIYFDGKYRFNVSKESKYIELQLKSPKGYSYILRRAI